MSCLIIFFGASKHWRRTRHTHKGSVDAFPLVFPFFLDRSAKVRLAGQEILELHDFVLSSSSPATHFESSVYMSHYMIVQYLQFICSFVCWCVVLLISYLRLLVCSWYFPVCVCDFVSILFLCVRLGGGGCQVSRGMSVDYLDGRGGVTKYVCLLLCAYVCRG